MCDTLRMITSRVNVALGTHFNTILMNVYRSGDDCIGYHRDNETGWAPNTGFATLNISSLDVTRLNSFSYLKVHSFNKPIP
eukprot:COSAG03_NODE_9275_length_732_cov_2.364929_1_plen_81_part_00